MAFHDNIVAAVPRKVYANAHAYHINSISLNSDGETYMSADDLRINLWNLNISDQSFSGSRFTSSSLNSWHADDVWISIYQSFIFLLFIMLYTHNGTKTKRNDYSLNPHLDTNTNTTDILDIKPANMEELTEVITAAEFHPTSCNLFCYSSSKGTVKLADMRDSALCDRHAKSGWCAILLYQRSLLTVSFSTCRSVRRRGGPLKQILL